MVNYPRQLCCPFSQRWYSVVSDTGQTTSRPTFACRRLHKAIDFVVCLGGDGVLLHASSLFMRAIPPVISFNLGSLGFLTNHTFDDFRRDLRDVITGGEDLVECSLPGEVMRVRGHERTCCNRIDNEWTSAGHPQRRNHWRVDVSGAQLRAQVLHASPFTTAG